MSNAAKHRKKAAEFEQLKQIDRAIASYVKAIEESEAAGEDVDVALYNKVGDLALRQGRVPDAITYYERAVEHYATSGLFNNAIALCNKILRNAPGRANVYFTLGRISARKGLRGDATRNFLEYATRMQQEGRIEEGIRALAEVLDLMPELNDVRTMVEDLAARSGIALPRRRTPLRADRVPTPSSTPVVRDNRSQDLIFLDIDYGDSSRQGGASPIARTPTPVVTPAQRTPAAPVASVASVDLPMLDTSEPAAVAELPMLEDMPAVERAPVIESPVIESPVIELPVIGSLVIESPVIDSPEIPAPDLIAEPAADVQPTAVPTEELPTAIAPMLEGLEANGEFGDTGTTPVLEGFTSDEAIELTDAVDPSVHPADVTWILPPETAAESIQLDEVISEEFENATSDPNVVKAIYTETPAFVPAVVEDALIETADIDRPLADETLDVDGLVIERLEVETVPELEEAIEAGRELVALAQAEPVPTPLDAVVVNLDDVEEQLAPTRPPFRLDPHDFILPGELPPLVLDDEVVAAGLTTVTGASTGTAHDSATEAALAASPAAASAVAWDTPVVVTETPAVSGVTGTAAESALEPQTLALETEAAPAVPSQPVTAADSSMDAVAGAALLDAADVPDASAEATTDAGFTEATDEALTSSTGRPVSVTPSLPIAAVAEAAATVASSRRDSLRAAVARLPRNWLLRRRLAEALFEAGERDAALHELETAQQGLVNDGEFSAASDIADELVHVSPDRVAYHQKRVELAVRSNDQQRLRFAYLDLADALVRLGEEGRARAVYARVLEIDPYDDRARAALGAAAPPPPPPAAPATRPDDSFVDLADWLRDDDKPVDTRMRMREPAISGDEQADFDALLRHFKEGVSRSLGEDDFESHYDLGVAYKEMGLLDDAITEFQKALRSRTHRLPAYEALGQCFVEQGRFQVAATVLSRALHEPGLDDDKRVGVLYLLGYSCEALQRKDEARSYFQRVYATDINFRDVAARLAAIEQASR